MLAEENEIGWLQDQLSEGAVIGAAQSDGGDAATAQVIDLHAVKTASFQKDSQSINVDFDVSIFDNVSATMAIVIRAGGLAEQVNQAIDALIQTGLVYDRGGVLCAIDRHKMLHAFNSSSMRLVLSRAARWTKPVVTKSGCTNSPADPPKDVAETIVKMTAWRGICRLDAVVDHPVVDLQNEVVRIGYTPKHRLFGKYDETAFPKLNASVTKLMAEEALIEFIKCLETFDFESACDQAAAICAMLTAVSRAILRTAPMILIDAPMPGSGKGELGSCIAHVSSDGDHVGKHMPSDDNEISKSILSALLVGRAVCYWDEVASNEIDCPALRMLITNEHYGQRMLGSNTEVSVSTKTLLIVNGNNISATADTARRILPIRLNPRCENPSLRQFKQSPRKMVKTNRGLYISLLLTVQRAYLQAASRGEVEIPGAKTNGFDEWEQLCRLPVLWLTGVDPCAKMIESMKSNPAKAVLVSVLQCWIDEFGDSVISAGQALGNIDFATALSSILPRRPGSIVNAVSLGLFLRKNKDQIVGGMSLIAAGERSGTNYWQVKRIGKAGGGGGGGGGGGVGGGFSNSTTTNNFP